MITGLPIPADAPVVGFLIASKQYGEGCDATFAANPVSLPIPGAYDSYGRVDPDPAYIESVETGLTWLRPQVAKIVDCNYEFGATVHDPATMPLSKWIYLAERGGIQDDECIYVQINEYEKHPRRIQLSLMHRFAYDWLLTQGYDVRKEECLIPWMSLSPLAYNILGRRMAQLQAPKVRELAYDTFQLCSGMEALRCTWRANPGGSQTESWEKHAELMHKSLEYIEAVKSWNSDQYELDFGD